MLELIPVGIAIAVVVLIAANIYLTEDGSYNESYNPDPESVGSIGSTIIPPPTIERIAEESTIEETPQTPPSHVLSSGKSFNPEITDKLTQYSMDSMKNAQQEIRRKRIRYPYKKASE